MVVILLALLPTTHTENAYGVMFTTVFHQHILMFFTLWTHSKFWILKKNCFCLYYNVCFFDKLIAFWSHFPVPGISTHFVQKECGPLGKCGWMVWLELTVLPSPNAWCTCSRSCSYGCWTVWHWSQLTTARSSPTSNCTCTWGYNVCAL